MNGVSSEQLQVAHRRDIVGQGQDANIFLAQRFGLRMKAPK